jgi:hypothetical protein
VVGFEDATTFFDLTSFTPPIEGTNCGLFTGDQTITLIRDGSTLQLHVSGTVCFPGNTFEANMGNGDPLHGEATLRQARDGDLRRRDCSERPVLLAVDQELGEGATLWVAPELADPVGALEVGEHQDVEQLGAGSGTEGFETFRDSAFELVGTHGLGADRWMESYPLDVGGWSHISPSKRRR